MPILIGIALKSLLIAGITLGLLQLMKGRSPSERSCVAHIGLLTLVVMAVAPAVLPSLTVNVPAPPAALVSTPVSSPAPVVESTHAIANPGRATFSPAAASELPRISPVAITLAAYAIPAAVLLFLTFLALARLIALRARADVLVDGHWLSALARAQRRMGFKHGTALLTSNDLASPISWGVVRPVILLSSRAVEAADEAEAIIAHELAHVARMDWVKLLLARVATALFWFNPLVWILAREAHQLREETADDSVLAANIADTDYAQLLVGVARHECPGLLLGAHGVAPSKSSLARRVARVLDGKLVRRPAARPFAYGVFGAAVLVSAPLAALTIAPSAPALPTAAATSKLPVAHLAAVEAEVPTDLPHIIAKGVSTSVATATAAIAPRVAAATASMPHPAAAPSAAMLAETTVRAPDGSTVTVYPPDASGRSKTVARSASGVVAIAYANAEDGDVTKVKYKTRHRDNAVDMAIQMKALGITADYVTAMRAAAPGLRAAALDDIVAMRALGITPDYARQVASAGYGSLGADDLEQAKAVGITPEFLRSIRATGVQASIDEMIELKSMGISPEELARVRASGAVSKRKLRQLVTPPEVPQPPGG